MADCMAGCGKPVAFRVVADCYRRPDLFACPDHLHGTVLTQVARCDHDTSPVATVFVVSGCEVDPTNLLVRAA